MSLLNPEFERGTVLRPEQSGSAAVDSPPAAAPRIFDRRGYRR